MIGNLYFVCSSNDHNCPVLLLCVKKNGNVNKPFTEPDNINNNNYNNTIIAKVTVGSSAVVLSFSGGSAAAPYTWITDRAFKDDSQIPQCLQHRAVLSFITLQTRTGAWSCLYFSLCDTSSLSCLPPPNPLLSRLYPSPPPPLISTPAPVHTNTA